MQDERVSGPSDGAGASEAPGTAGGAVGPLASLGARLSGPTAATFAVNVAIFGLGFATSVPMARWMGPSGRGEVAAAMLWPVLLVYMLALGQIQAVLYFTASEGAERDRVFGTAAVLVLAQSALACGIGYALIPLLLPTQRPEIVAVSRLLLAIVPFSLLREYGWSMLQARLRFRLFNTLRLFIPVLYLAGIGALHLAGRLTPVSTTVLFLWLNVAACVVTVVVLAALGLVRRPRWDRGLAGRMLRYGLQVHAGDLSQLGNLRLDQALISAWFAPAQLGLYVAAVSAANVLQVVSLSLKMVVTPRVATEQSLPAQLATLRRAFVRYCVLGGGVAVALAAALPWAVPFTFGRAFAAAVGPALVLTAATACLGAKDVLAGGAQALGKPWLSSRAEILGGVVTVVGLLALLRPFGIMGAAIATLGSYASQLVVVVLGLAAALGISPAAVVGLAAVRTGAPPAARSEA